MIEQADVVVIGSGGLGASTAFHLANSGRRVALVDQHALGSQTSPRAAGLTSQARGTDVMAEIAKRAVWKIRTFAAETGEALEFVAAGALKIARFPRDVAQIASEVVRSRRLGTGIEMIAPAEARALNPFLETTGILGVIWSPNDIYLEPSQVPRLYARAAAKQGAVMLPHTRVTGIATHAGAVTGVQTEQGVIHCETVVDAAGAWLRAVAALAGGRVAAVPTRHQLLITVAFPEVAASQPITRIIDTNVYMRPCDGGLMLGGYEANPRLVPQALPIGYDVGTLELDLGVLHDLADSVREQLPIFQRVPGEIAIREHRGGLPTMTPDGLLNVGPVPGVRGLYVAGGCCVGGLSISPAIGEALAAWIVDGKAPMDLSALAPARHIGMAEDALIEACRLRYANSYRAVGTETNG